MRDRNVFFSFISLSVYFLCQMLIWPGSEFIRWPTRLSHAGVYVLRLAFNLMSIKFLYNKSFDEKDTFQCHLLQSLRIISYSVPFLNSKWKNHVLPQNNLVEGQLLPVIQNFLAPSKKKKWMEYFISTRTWICERTFVQQFSIALREILHRRFVEEQRSYTRYHGSINVFRYSIGSRGVGRIRDGYVNLRRCFGLK